MTIYNKTTVTAVASDVNELTGGAVKLGAVTNPGDGLRYIDGHRIRVWNTATSRTAGKEAAAYYAAAAAFWAKYVYKNADRLTIRLLRAISDLCGEGMPPRIRESYEEGRVNAENAFYGLTRTLRRDGRYTVNREHTGKPGGPHHVARFCGDWIDQGVDEADAWRLAYLHRRATFGPDTDKTSETSTGDAGGSGDVRATV